MDPIRSRSPGGVADMQIDEPEPVTLGTVSQDLYVLQDQIAGSFGNLAQVERLADEAFRILNEKGGEVARSKPHFAPHIAYLKFMVGFDLADEWVFKRLSIPPQQAYTQEQKRELSSVYTRIVHSEQYLPRAFLSVMEDLSFLFTWNFNSLWTLYLKAFCLIGMNIPAPAIGQLCSSCQGSAGLLWLMQNVDPILRNSLNPNCEQLIANVRQNLNTLALRAIRQFHPGPCFDDTLSTGIQKKQRLA